MAAFKVARYEVRPKARADAERVMHELATVARADRDSMWTTYRAPTHYISLLRAKDPAPFVAALAPFVDGTIEFTEYELVTSSDLARRPRIR